MTKPKKARRKNVPKGPREKTRKMRKAYRDMVQLADVSDTVDLDTIFETEQTESTKPGRAEYTEFETVIKKTKQPSSYEPGFFQKHWQTIIGVIALPIIFFGLKYLIGSREDIAQNKAEIKNIKTSIISLDNRSKEDRKRLENQIHGRLDRIEDKVDKYLIKKEK